MCGSRWNYLWGLNSCSFSTFELVSLWLCPLLGGRVFPYSSAWALRQGLCYLHVIIISAYIINSHCALRTPLSGGSSHYFHFIDEKTKAQRGEITFPRPHSSEKWKLGFESFLCGLKSPTMLAFKTCHFNFPCWKYIFLFFTILWGTYNYSLHFINEETKTQRGEFTYPRSHSH